MNPKGMIFDLDGTLLDSMAVWDTVAERLLLSRGITAPPGLRQLLKPMTLPDCAQYLIDGFELSDSVQALVDEVNAMIEDHYRFHAPLKPYVADFLEKSKEHGIKMCVATATDRHLVEYALHRVGIARYFEFILTCYDVGAGKETPVIYLEALRRLGTSQDKTIVFEDAYHAAKTAKEAGFYVVGLADPSAASERAEMELVVDRFCNSFKECEALEA